MLLPVRDTIQLSGGSVTLRAWPATLADAHLMDLLTLTATLTHLQDQWEDYQRRDIEPPIWAAYWRLVHASLEPGSTLPERLTWRDRLALLTAMWELNSLEDAEGKLTALRSHATRLMARIQSAQGRTTPPSMSS